LVGSQSLLLRGAAAVPLIDSVVGGGLDADVRTAATGRAGRCLLVAAHEVDSEVALEKR